MSVVLSLLRAIDRADGEALVMHVGEKPYVVTATGHAELAAKPLTIPAMTGMLDQLLPPESRQALDELGAVEYHLPPQPGSAPDSRYSVVAARGGDDIWIEVRRRKAEPEVQAVPEVHHAPEVQRAPEVQLVQAPAAIAAASAEPETYTLETSGPITFDEPAPTPIAEVEADPVHAAIEHAAQPVTTPEPVAQEQSDVFTIEDTQTVDEAPVAVFEEPHAAEFEQDAAPFEAVSFEVPHAISFEDAVATTEQVIVEAIDEPEVTPDNEANVIVFEQPTVFATEDGDDHYVERPAATLVEETRIADQPVDITAEEPAVHAVATSPSPEQPTAITAESVARTTTPEPAETAEPAKPEPQVEVATQSEPEPEIEPEPEPAVTHHLAPVVPMAARGHIRFEPASVSTHPRGEGLPHLLQVAAAHGASVLYVAVQAKPSLRVDGEIRVLEHETPLSEAMLEAGLKTILPNGSGPAAGEVQTCDVPGVGRVQCLSFRDHRGLGAMFKMLPARAISSEQMGLGAPIQALCTETEGLVLVAGARGAGKSTLVAALVDQMNRTRRDHVITVEQQIQFVHENRQSFVSQREARDDEAFAAAVKSALREGPDVMVVDQVASAQAADLALQAAAGGLLVIASVTAATTSAALGRFMELFGENRAQARLTLSEHLRGVITQSLLRKTGGGRAAAREVLVNVPSVAALIANAQIDDLSSVLNNGRRVGMVPLNDALLALVQSGALDVREAYRKSPDQQELVGQLNRAGLDTTFAERPA